MLDPLLLLFLNLFPRLHQVLVAAYEIFSCGTWALVPWPGNEPEPSALVAWSLSPWTTKVPLSHFF